ncbi:hypothetical protein D5F01_LYC08988 [Larimichthys crocea]|uniref:Uncharacterized protein n=1 Tax=Larimichthys crocea TaxID=215358 RepID=A0A6G0IK44_LARCR|nr:hypothetical protein D5F01_LYC08988 [Larimichthys crocea]
MSNVCKGTLTLLNVGLSACRINRLEGLLKLRETEFKTEFKKSYETISSFEAQVSSLQKQLQSKDEEIVKIQLLRKQENDLMTARLESEKQKLQESAVLQNDLQQKLKQMEQQLRQKDKEILDLQKNNEDLSHKLTKVSTEFLQSDNTWQTKYNGLQEKFTEELATKQQRCEATEEQLVEEKKKVEELHLKMINEKTEKDQKDQEINNKDKQEIDRLSQELTEATSELRSCRVEFLQSNKAWQGQYSALEEKFREQLVQKEQDWKKKLQLVEEEKNSLIQEQQDSERTLKLVEEEKNPLVQEQQDSERTLKLVEEEKNPLVQEQQDSERTLKLVEEEKNPLVQEQQDSERSQEDIKSNEGTVVTPGTQTEEKKKKKKKKGFFSWMRKKKRCGSQTGGEEAPCCSTQVTQQ